MNLYENIGNMHIHTPFSDGEGTHKEIAQAARLAGLDFIITTDHNIWVDGVQGYYGSEKEGYVLLLTGEEVHDRRHYPLGNHCLIYGIDAEVSQLAGSPQHLINETRKQGGLSFFAHPFDGPIQWTKDSHGFEWQDWDLTGYNGLEIWNYMSSFKAAVKNPFQAARDIFLPENVVDRPDQRTIDKWDELLAQGLRVTGIGGADAHATRVKFGPIAHTVFSYDFLFQCVNTHVLTSSPLTGQAQHDAQLLYTGLKAGRTFVSYGLVGSARGFRFTAQGGKGGTSIAMGSGIRLEHGVTLQALAPRRARMKLIHNGELLLDEAEVENLTYVARQPGAYRVEVWQEFKGQERCWILSNPIYVEPNIGPITDDVNYIIPEN